MMNENMHFFKNNGITGYMPILYAIHRGIPVDYQTELRSRSRIYYYYYL